MQPVQIHRYSSEEVFGQSISVITSHLHQELQTSPVFLLLSGGSAISLYLPIFRALIAQQAPLHQLTLSLMDERFVPKRNLDSNEQQIMESGVIGLLLPLGVKWVGMLDDQKTTGAERAKNISEQFDSILSTTPTVIAIAGMGEDGHTAGILPTKDHSPNKELLTESQANVVFYIVNTADSNNPYKQRLTTTSYFFTKIDKVFVYATGEKKQSALETFIAGTEPIHICPAIALRYSKATVEVLTDLETE